jgi:hypothetical protein
MSRTLLMMSTWVCRRSALGLPSTMMMKHDEYVVSVRRTRAPLGKLPVLPIRCRFTLFFCWEFPSLAIFLAWSYRSVSAFLSAFDFLRASLRSAAFFCFCCSAILFSFSTCLSRAYAFRFAAAISRFVGSFFPPFSDFLTLGGLSIFFFFPFFDDNFPFGPSSFATPSNFPSRLIPKSSCSRCTSP